MTSVFQLSEMARSLLSLWTFCLLIAGIFSMVRSVSQKNIRLAVLSLIPVGSSYFLWQILFDFHLNVSSGSVTAVSLKSCEIPVIYWLLFLLSITVTTIAILVAVIRYGNMRITPDAVKICLDQIPCGVCCFDDDGTIRFSNVCMKRLCAGITGEKLLDGKRLYDAVVGKILEAEGRKWRFTGNDIIVDKEILHEIIASDITVEYTKTEKLQKDKEELSLMKTELKKHNLNIGETIKQQEILQAKINIHDEMNRLMLSTMATDKEDRSAEDQIFSLWEQNALLLCMEADRNTELKEISGIEKLAKALRISLVWKNAVPDELSNKQLELLFSAMKEAIANAAKHADAKQIEISFSETDDVISCVFSNDGTMRAGEVHFAGGLYNLSILAKKQGVAVHASAGDYFELVLDFPKEKH